MKIFRWCTFAMAVMVNGNAYAESRIDRLHAEAEEIRLSEDYKEAARATELIAFAEALDPVQDDYFDDTERAKAKSLRKACATMDHAACTDLAKMYDRGHGTWQDQALARSIYLISCEEGHLPACEQYTLNEGQMLYLYDGLDPTISHFTKSCAADNAAHCHRLAFQQPDEDAREALLDLACDLGHLDSCSLRNNWDRYIAAARQQCDTGIGAGCAGLARVHQIGEHLDNDPSKERALRDQACTFGHAASCRALGRQYEDGTGVTTDFAKALEYYQRGCEVHPLECWTVANRYLKGEIVERDDDRAMLLAQRTCDADGVLPEHPACKFVRGNSGPTDIHTLLPSHIRPYADTTKDACSQNDGAACLLLSQYYWQSELSDRFKKTVIHDLHKTSCGLGYLPGCTQLALKDHRNPDLDLLQETCDAGEWTACERLFRQSKDGTDETRIAELKDGCDAGIGIMCHILAQIHQNDRNAVHIYGINIPNPDHTRALALFEQGCDLGYGRSCYWMWLSAVPEGKFEPYAHLPKNAAKALVYRERACTHGDTWQCEMLVYDLRGTEGRSADLKQARHFAQIGCEQGDCNALEQVILLETRAALSAEHGPLKAALTERYDDFDTPARALVRRARRSCKSGLLDGCIRLAEAYDNGDNDFWGLKQQLTHSPWVEALLLHACEGGSAQGCYRYGDMFQYGYHNDDAIAAEYLGRACDMGYELACKN